MSLKPPTGANISVASFLNELDARLVFPEDYGAVGDGTTDDTAAFNLAEGNNVTLVLKPGTTYLVDNFALTSRSNFTIEGNGATLKRKAGDGDKRICTFTDCSDIRINNVRFDLNNVEKFGGVVFYAPARVWLTNNYIYDSNLRSSWSSFDHYGFVVNKNDGGTRAADVWCVDNICEDAELLELDNCERVVVGRNIVRRCAGTAAIGSFTVGSAETVNDIEIFDNLIVDPRKQGIVFQHESGGLDNNTWRNIRIERNAVLHLSATAGTSRGLGVGNFTGSASTGNTYDQIVLQDNLLYRAAALSAMTAPHLFVQQQSGNTFNGLVVKGNRVFANTTDWAIDVRRGTEATVQDNLVRGTATHGMEFLTFTDSVIAGNRSKAATNAFQFSSSGGGNVLRDNTAIGSPTNVWSTSSAITATDRVRAALGAKSVASAATVTLPIDTGNVVLITGTTNIDSITATGMHGRAIVFEFGGVLTMTDASNLDLNGNFVSAAGDIIALHCDGTNWNELYRRRATPQTYAASNVTVDRTYDADTVLVAELADIVGTLIADLRAQGVLT